MRRDESVSFFSAGSHPPSLFRVRAMMPADTVKTENSSLYGTLNCFAAEAPFWPRVWALVNVAEPDGLSANISGKL